MYRRRWTARPGRPGHTRVPAHGRFITGGLPAAAVAAALAVAMLPTVTGSAPARAASTVRADDVTISSNSERWGWDQNEPTMGASAVKSYTQLFKTSVTGQVYAQPVVVGNTLIVATENDYVYGLDATTGAVLWKTSLGTPFNITKSSSSALRSCGDLVPNIGVTGTPVYDPATGSVYMFAAFMVGSAPKFDLFGVDVTTGAKTLAKRIWGHPTNDKSLTFSPAYQGQRTGALLMNGWVYGAFASHCDKKPYAGYVAGVNVSTAAGTLWTDENKTTPSKGGIWHGGGGLMSDGSGRIFVTSGNGVSPPKGPGTSPPGQLAESVIRLGINSSGSLAAKDFFSPANAPSLDAADTDFGSGGPVALPFGTATYPDVLVQAGKDGRIFLLNRDSLGGREQASGGKDADLSVTTPYGGLWGHPATFGDTTPLTSANAATADDYVYYVGKSDVLRVFKVGVNGSDKPVLSDVANSKLTYGYTSGSPVITSNGADATTPVLWVVHTADKTGANAELEAYDVSSAAIGGCTSSATCSLSPIWSAPIGTAAKFATPATSNGMVYVGTRGGVVYGFGPTPPASPLAPAPATFGHTSVSATTAQTVSVTAASPVTITGVTATTGASNATTPTAQFTVGTVTETKKGSSAASAVTFPVTLATGDKLSAQVRFAPAAPGGADGSLSFATTSARFPAIAVPLSGTATINGLYAEPGDLSFPLAPDQGIIDVPVGISIPQSMDIINGGTTTVTVKSVQPPTGPFSAVGLPAAGDTIKPGQSVAAQITFSPSRPGPVSDSFTITDTNGTSVIVTLSGIGTAGISRLTPSHRTLFYGSVPVGQSRTENVHITNTGNQPSTLTGASPLAAPFHAVYTVPKNLPFSPSYDLTVPVRFTPAKAGTFTAHYTLTWTDRLGTHHLTVTLTGKGV
jgi:PQQ-like domain/Abnormal spindle-like microcephaly-assoc'd, ASPM-SPD-2-Hydin/HYDIN/CFA65/VesB-like, Ig-like domain